MKEFKTWSWGFIPAAAALALIWFEFWQSGRTHRQPLPPVAPPEQQEAAAAPPANPTPELPLTPEPRITGPSLLPASTTTAATTTTPAPEPLDARLFTDPPPISLRVNDATLTELASALSSAVGGPTSVFAASSGSSRYTLDVKNKPFWDVFQALQDQAPFMAIENTTGLRLAPADPPAGGIRHFQRHGPAILFARSMSYSRTSSGTGSMNLVMGTVIDPRLKVTRHAPILILNAVDDAGRVQAVPELPVGESMQARPGNMWTQSVSWPAPDAMPKNITFHCEVRFGAEISTSVPSVTVMDAENKNGETVALGDQQVRIVRFAYEANRISVQLAPAQGGTLSVNFMVSDANGKTFGNSTSTASSAAFAATDAQAPFRLIMHGATGETKTLSYQFELPEIPVP